MSRLLRPKNADVEAGFSTLELVLSVAIIGVVCASAFVAYNNALPLMRADSAMQLLEAALRQARETSVDTRRNFTVTFQGTSELVGAVTGVTCSTSSTPPCFDYFLPERMVYTLFTGVPDTPDGFGNAAAVNYNCPSGTLPCTITFSSDGSVEDGQSGSDNGTIFIGIPGQTKTARAVTILSATGKIKGWQYNGTGWN